MEKKEEINENFNEDTIYNELKQEIENNNYLMNNNNNTNDSFNHNEITTDIKLEDEKQADTKLVRFSNPLITESNGKRINHDSTNNSFIFQSFIIKLPLLFLLFLSFYLILNNSTIEEIFNKIHPNVSYIKVIIFSIVFSVIYFCFDYVIQHYFIV